MSYQDEYKSLSDQQALWLHRLHTNGSFSFLAIPGSTRNALQRRGLIHQTSSAHGVRIELSKKGKAMADERWVKK